MNQMTLIWGHGPKIAFYRALITWMILLLVYACFQFLWQVVNQANNYQGPVYTLYPSSASNPTISRVSNWSVTITRGIVGIAIGLLITKIGHKKAVIFAFSMIFLSIPFIFTPYMKDSMINNSNMDENATSQFSYALFIIFRLFLAVGGTAITILQAPIIAKFFLSAKKRNTAIKIGNVPAQAAGIIASLIFIKQVVGNPGIVAKNWQLVSGIIMILIVVLFIIYLIIGMHFKLGAANKVEKTHLSEADSKQNSMLWLLKQPKIMIFILAGMFSLYAGIEPGSGVLSNFWQTTTITFT